MNTTLPRAIVALFWLACAPASIALAQPAIAPVAAAAVTLPEAIRDRIDHLRYETQHDVRGARIMGDELVARYYESQQFQPAWQEAGRLDTLITALGEMRDDGLDPEDYHYAALQSYRLDLRMNQLTVEDRANLDLLATDAFMLSLYHLFLGKAAPQKLSPQWNFSQRPVPVSDGLQRLAQRLAAGEIRETYAAARPQHVWYQRGRERVREYRAIAAAGGWPRVADGPTLKPGMQDPRVPVLRQRLRITQDLAPASAVAPTDETLFDPELATAVQDFQSRHGLTADGAVGPGTRAALNVPVESRIDQIRVNLERARWTLHEIKGEFVLVDVAGFYVSYFRDDEPI